MKSEDNEQSAYYEYFKIIQNTINRLARNSFLIKAWTITLIGSVSILTFSIINTLIFSVLAGITVVFWILDSYYLKVEKLYRMLYNDNVEKFNNPNLKGEIVLFNMKTDNYLKKSVNILKIMFSKTEGIFYLSLIIGLMTLLILNIIIP